MEDKPRFRINAHQTAKGLWQFDATLEYNSDKISADDESDTGAQTTLGLRLLSLIKETEKAFTNDGRQIIDKGETA